ncbi:Chemotaxis protein CheA [BD1-7 clade bacterium]|uniref:Chemotaxis protein CheA n=1 Tax=BD1-7 clade bacterium TaxID=2029982 RepID=A0A5S9MSE9_9GAMM|nr:Chemotaxis protein CheA [BD1-7 clade bacterium]CAA0084227.1 Chemotaxis protein CheA [BD1-7 clade bacterium]
MSEKRRYMALDWVRNEIQETLQQAVAALQAYAVEPEDVTKLRFALTYVHQVGGSLTMIEQHGAALLAKEIEDVLVAAADGPVGDDLVSSLTVITQAIDDLLRHLADTAETGIDEPQQLLAPLNAVRALKLSDNDDEYTEADVFNPDVNSPQSTPAQEPTVSSQEFNALIKKLRHHYQRCLLNIARDKDLAASYQVMVKVATALYKASRRTASEPLWEVVYALIDQLQKDARPADLNTKKALKHIDCEIKSLQDGGREALGNAPDSAILKALLYGIAVADTETDLIRTLKNTYQLEEALEQKPHSVEDIRTMSITYREVIDAAHENLAATKDAIHEFIANQFDVTLIEAVPDHLRVLSELCDAEPFVELKPLLQMAQDHVVNHLLKAGANADWDQLEAFADAISSIDYYFECLDREEQKNLASIIDVARESLGRLGFHAEVVSGDADTGSNDVVEADVNGIVVTEDPNSEPQAAFVPEVDEEILEIFVEEAEEVLENIRDFLPKLTENRQDQDALVEVRRAYHTLKGSGRMVGAEMIGEFAWSIERMLNNVMDGVAKLTNNSISVLNDATSMIEPVMLSFEGKGSVDEADVAAIVARADAEFEGRSVDTTLESAGAPTDSEVVSGDMSDVGVDASENVTEYVTHDDIDDDLREIFVAEAESHIQVFLNYLDAIDPGYQDVEVSQDIQRAFHTLKGSAYMAGIASMAELVTPLEGFVKDLSNFQIKADAEILACFFRASEMLQLTLTAIVDQSPIDMVPIRAFAEEIAQLHSKRIEIDDESSEPSAGTDYYQRILTCAVETLGQTADVLDAWRSDGVDETQFAAMAEAMLALSEVAEETAYIEVAQLAEAVAMFYQRQLQASQDDLLSVGLQAQDCLDDMFDVIAAHQEPQANLAMIALLNDDADDMAESDGLSTTAQSEDQVAVINVNDALKQQLAASDEDTLEIFVEECCELVELLQSILEEWVSDPTDMSLLGEIKRYLHTIKGGARLAEVAVIADVAHYYESLIETSELTRTFDDAVMHQVHQYQGQLEKLLEQTLDIIDGVTETPMPEMSLIGIEPDQAVVDASIDELITSEEISPSGEGDSDEAVVESESELLLEYPALENNADDSIVLLDEPDDVTSIDEMHDDVPSADTDEAELELLVTEQDVVVVDDELTDEGISVDDGLLESMLDDNAPDIQESDDIITPAEDEDAIAIDASEFVEIPESDIERDVDDVNEIVDHAAKDTQTVSDGSADELSEDLSQHDGLVIAEIEDDADIADVDIAACEQPPGDTLDSTNEDVETDAQDVADARQIQVDFSQLATECGAADEDTMEIFIEEAQELSLQLEESCIKWLDNHNAVDQSAELKRILHTLKGGARMTELPTLGNLTHDFESMIEYAEARAVFDDGFFTQLDSYHDVTQKMIEGVVNGGTFDTDVVELALPIAEPIIAAPQPVMANMAPVVLDVDVSALDPDVLELFLEEAYEQLEAIEVCIGDFLRDRSQQAPLEELKRVLHTLKGGARLAEITPVGNLSHDFESHIIQAERDNRLTDDVFADDVQSYHEQLNQQLQSLKAAVQDASDKSSADDVSIEESVSTDNVVPIRPDIDIPASEQPVSQAAIDATRNFLDSISQKKNRKAQEPVKVSPDQLQSLMNLAGESSIGRSRIEEQVSDLHFSLDDMSSTVDRLQGQLRRLEIETEAQIVFRQEQVVSEGQENFDPLEMDRYTHMQQLSKSLIESASDLDDITGTLGNKMRDVETLLLQQSRINSDLQEGLMRAQMVPFSRMVPRLRRIVRQVAAELGKKVDFEVKNAEGELDRTILDRMVAPLEHMLRNAVDHGIEMPEERIAAGKPEKGTITLILSREGGEIDLRLVDDGGGVNLDAVRRKAIDRGLIDASSTLSDHEVCQFILAAGFSTAEKVTQISGRGVGMDVVHSEIKQMGGSIEINSTQGIGSTFTVLLPFTVSVNRALMVCIGNDTYAIPLNTIEGIVRVSPYELEAYYQPEAPLFEYAGQSYHLRYLGSMLSRNQVPHLEGLTMPLPVVLIRSNEYTVAVQVDRLFGSQEVVVKTLGPQFAMVEGLSGATVLGDGSVVVILDMLALIRANVSRGITSEADVAAGGIEADSYEEVRNTVVMVVDDSVTVRKVTSRLLERHSMDVVLAKDGLDAITQLQEMDQLPDIILLDIEMPRMDGFEVVSRVRHNTRLQHIPVCMITSRTGEKHRERAISLGASEYLGKPFQERELLQTISDLTGSEVMQA